MVLLILIITAICLGSLTNAASTNRTNIEKTDCTRRFVNDNGNSQTERYQCPDFGDTLEQTQCCDRMLERCCVATKATKFYELPQHLAILISVVVVLAAIIFAGAMIVCCCWERCPLYMACRAEAKPDYIAKPDDVGDSLMPGGNMEDAKMYEFVKASKVYNPVN